MVQVWAGTLVRERDVIPGAVEGDAHALADILVSGFHLVHGGAARQRDQGEDNQQFSHDLSSST
jgi:hypothetical protein